VESFFDVIVLDRIPPAGTMSINDCDVWTGSPDVTLNSSVTGASEMRFRDPEGSWSDWQSYAAEKAWTLPGPDGDKVVEAEYRDAAQNVTSFFDSIELDMTPPVGTMVINDCDVWTGSPDVTLNSSVTGASEMRFRDPEGSWSDWQSYAAEKAWALPGPDGDKVVEAEYLDPAGNPLHVSDDIVLDTRPPETTDSTDAAWHAGPCTVTLAPTDAGCGVARTEYRVDGGAWQTGTAVTLTTWKRGGGGGGRTIEYRSFDNLGHEETAHTCVAQLDCRPPGTLDDAPTGVQHTDVTVHFTATDGQSGVKQTRYRLDGVAWQVGGSVTIPAMEDGSNDGVHWIEYYSIDNVGNAETRRHTCSVTIDTSGGGGGPAPAAAPARHAVHRWWRWAHGRLIVHLPHTTRTSVR